MFSSAWSTNGTYNTYYSSQNTTNGTRNMTPTLLDTAGVVKSTFSAAVANGAQHQHGGVRDGTQPHSDGKAHPRLSAQHHQRLRLHCQVHHHTPLRPVRGLLPAGDARRQRSIPSAPTRRRNGGLRDGDGNASSWPSK